MSGARSSVLDAQSSPVGLTPQGLGHAVRHLRARRRLTQRGLARQAGLRRQHLSEVEQGKGNPTLGTIRSIASGLGLRPAELLAEAERYSGRLP
jgi:transcriptional regulator with XRE-family HTH domain